MNMRSSIDAALLATSPPQPDANGAVALEFRFPSDDPVFTGHFPGRPLVPGAFQLEMIRAAAEFVLHCKLAVIEIGRAKFLRPIAPGETVRLEMKLAKKEGVLEARAAFSVYGQPAGEAVLRLRECE